MRTLESALRDSAESVRDAASQLPEHRWDPPRQRQVTRGVLMGLSTAAIVLIVFAAPVWLSLQTRNVPAAPSPPVNSPPGQPNDSELIGEPVSDAEYLAQFPDAYFVSGTAHRLASSQVPGLGLFEVYTVRMNGFAPEDQFAEPMTCITNTHGTVCVPDFDPTELRIVGGSSCPPRQISVLGLDQGTTLILEFTDGSVVEVAPTYGTATWGWNDDELGLADFILSGADEATIREFERLKELFYPDLPTQPCD